MGRGRSTRLFGTGLALFALMLQLILSFGHIHADDLLPLAASGNVVLDRGQSATDHDDQLPGHAHDDCPICSVMYLAGTVVVPSSPVLSSPLQFVVTQFPPESTVFIIALFRPLPQIRDPPTV
jgi:hypothetical protein